MNRIKSYKDFCFEFFQKSNQMIFLKEELEMKPPKLIPMEKIKELELIIIELKSLEIKGQIYFKATPEKMYNQGFKIWKEQNDGKINPKNEKRL